MKPAPPVTRTFADKGLDARRRARLRHGHRELSPLGAETSAALLQGLKASGLGLWQIVRVEDEIDAVTMQYGLEVGDHPEHGHTGDPPIALAGIVIQEPDRVISRPRRTRDEAKRERTGVRR